MNGNGNISEYLDESGVTVAHFEYDPFGRTVINTDLTNQFDIRFSTKKRDRETGLYYYGYRYYDPQHGRWLSRDPFAELGGINIYAASENDFLNNFDYLGLRTGYTEYTVLKKTKRKTRIKFVLIAFDEKKCVCKYSVVSTKVTVYTYAKVLITWVTDPSEDALNSSLGLLPGIGGLISIGQIIGASGESSEDPAPSGAVITHIIELRQWDVVSADPMSYLTGFHYEGVAKGQPCPTIPDTIR